MLEEERIELEKHKQKYKNWYMAAACFLVLALFFGSKALAISGACVYIAIRYKGDYLKRKELLDSIILKNDPEWLETERRRKEFIERKNSELVSPDIKRSAMFWIGCLAGLRALSFLISLVIYYVFPSFYKSYDQSNVRSLILSSLILIIYLNMGRINSFFKKASLVFVVSFIELIVSELLNNTLAENIFYKNTETVISAVLNLLFYYLLCKGFITIFSVLYETKECAKWRRIMIGNIAIYSGSLLIVLLDCFAVPNVYTEIIAFVFYIIAVLVRIFTVVYLIDAFRYLKNNKIYWTKIEPEPHFDDSANVNANTMGDPVCE